MTQIATNALTSLADVKESLSISSSDHSKDNLIIRKINQATAAIESYCDRTFAATDYTEIINGSNIDELVLKQRPVNTFTSLEYRGTSENLDNWITLNSNYYFVDTDAGILKLLFSAQGRWNRWRATYNGGYTTIPSDLAEACAQLAAYYVQNADALVQVRAKIEGQRRIDYYQGITGFKNLIQQLGVDQVIDSYANWPLISE
jgi:hypothetical protein